MSEQSRVKPEGALRSNPSSPGQSGPW